MLKTSQSPTATTSRSLKPLYLLLTIAGSIAPWYWLLQDPSALLSLPLFFQRAFANNVAATVSSDLLISAIAFFCFAWFELKRLQIPRIWMIVYIALTFGIGLSCALPFFLYRREVLLENQL